MATHRIRTPVAGVNGDVGGVTFADGIADIDEIEHEAELRYFRGAGYGVEEIGDEPAVSTDVDGDGVPEELPRRNASADTWRAFAVAHGMTEDEAAEFSRDELAAHYYSKGEGQ